MTARPPRSRKPAELDVDRLMTRIESGHQSLRERVETLFDGLDQRMSRIENDVAQGRLEHRRDIAREIGEVRRDLGEGRDAIQLLRDDFDAHQKAENQIRAAEAVTISVAQVATSRRLLASIGKNTKITVWGVGLVGGACLVWLGANGPNLVKGLKVFGHGVHAMWIALGG